MSIQRFRVMTLLFLIITGGFASCLKHQESPNSLLEESSLQQKVFNWLDSKKTKSQPNKANNINLLKENLDFSKVRIEAFDNGDQLISIAIKASFQKTKETQSISSQQYLVVTNDSANYIKNAQIVLYTSNNNDENSSIPPNTLSNVLNLKRIDCDGRFTFLSITGKLMNKFEYRNGNIYSFSEVINQNSSPDRSDLTTSSSSSCTDWYLVTTYYLDGIPVYQESVYVGTTCEGCDDPNFQSVCPDGSGSGGGIGGAGDLVETTNISHTFEEDEETNTTGGSSAGSAPKIRYQYNAQVVRVNGQVSSVIVYPITIANNHEVYIDRFGRNTTRILSVYGHMNTWTTQGVLASITWRCLVFGRWIYGDGTSPEYNRTWSNSRTVIQ